MFNLYIDRPEHYRIIQNECECVFNKQTSRLMAYESKKGLLIFVLDRYVPMVSVEVSIYGQGQWATKAIFKHFAEFVFVEMGCKRMTCITRESNKKSIALNKRLGMIKEGVLKRATFDNESLILWAYFPENCKYLKAK